jgi:nucleotidyltransferase substrate binding protein (TIGR01987 family)
MKGEILFSIKKLEDAFNRLKEGADSAADELDKDGVIQRFEFTFELLWKTLKLFLDDQGILTKSPKETIQEAFRFELIKNEEMFLEMLEDRNRTSHIYNQLDSEKIYERIKTRYVKEIKDLLNRLKNQ